jgi:hypothetical protein
MPDASTDLELMSKVAVLGKGQSNVVGIGLLEVEKGRFS